MTAADVAAEVIDPRDPATLADYESGWRDAIGTEIRLGSAIRRCYSLPEPVQRTGLWALSGEIGVHMDRPSSFFSPAHLKNCSRGATARMRRGSRRRQENYSSTMSANETFSRTLVISTVGSSPG